MNTPGHLHRLAPGLRAHAAQDTVGGSARGGPARAALAVGLAVLLLLAQSPPPTHADEIPPVPSGTLRVLPARISLEHSADRQRVVVLLVTSDGITRDVTAEAQFQVEPAGIAVVEELRLRPVADGTGALTVRHAALSATAELVVTGAATDAGVQFERDVMPVLTRGGCNSGGCHGQARGKDGFHLSLFGYDPVGDHLRLTREQLGRRVDVAQPERSLLLRKSTGEVRHGGGERFGVTSPSHATLLRWIADGAPSDPPAAPRLVEISCEPERLVLESGDAASLVIRARYADGTDRDVTPLAILSTSDEPCAAVDSTGRVSAAARGEAWILARYGAFSVATQVLVIPRGLAFAYPTEDETNPIDRAVGDKLRLLRIAPSELCDDATFLRRATIDVVGAVPTPEELGTFLADAAPDKRTRLIDALLGRKEFVELWVMKWAERLQIKSSIRTSPKAMHLFHAWLRQRFEAGVGIDQIARELLQASGSVFEQPATSFFYAEPDPLKLAENVAQVFMGMRVQCAQCHNHPFDRWTQADYYGFAAFFGQIGMKRGQDPREWIVFNRGGGDVVHPVTKKPVAPKFLGGIAPAIKRGRDRRAVLAEWIASPANPAFARNVANIVWEHFFGRGIVHETDDVRVSNPPSNPALLELLATELAANHYDIKALVRRICASRAYHRATAPSTTNAGDRRDFSRAHPRRIRAEVLLDCIAQVANAPQKFQGLPLGARAVEIADGSYSTYFLTTFGRPTRESACSCELRLEPTLSQALHLINGDTVAVSITRGAVVSKLLASGSTPRQVVEQLYLRCFARPPTASEWETLEPGLTASGAAAPQWLEDLFWALLNSREFVFNH